MKFITTSWDDGHPLDFRLADLLSRYNLPATFYIPKENLEAPVMGEKEIQALSRDFEIGGHTLHHTRLAKASETTVKEEIGGCFRWLSELLAKPPVSFCFPGGIYNNTALQTVFATGFRLARTTELFNSSMPAVNQVVATTLQAYPHSTFTYAKHLAKRLKWTTLLHWMKGGSQTNLCSLAEQHLSTMPDSGCFHLWGHSWEIEKYGLWKTVEGLFKLIANLPDFTYVQNRSLVQQSQALSVTSLPTA